MIFFLTIKMYLLKIFENTQVQKMISRSSLMSPPRGNCTSNRPYDILLPSTLTDLDSLITHSTLPKWQLHPHVHIITFYFLHYDYLWVYQLCVFPWLITELAKEFIPNFFANPIYTLCTLFFLLTCSSLFWFLKKL